MSFPHLVQVDTDQEEVRVFRGDSPRVKYVLRRYAGEWHYVDEDTGDPTTLGTFDIFSAITKADTVHSDAQENTAPAAS